MLYHNWAFVFAAAWLAATTSMSAAQDSDGDGVVDATEAVLLQSLAPVFYSHNFVNAPPLPLDWVADRVEVRLYDQEYNGRSDRSGGTLLWASGAPLGIRGLADGDFSDQGTSGYYRLGFFDSAHQGGSDPTDLITWQRLQDEQRGIYGRVTYVDPTVCRDLYLVQYFVYFGLNETDRPSLGGCNNIGVHEGDWICVEFEAFYVLGSPVQIRRAVYNNHGRKIFVDSAAGLDFENGYPVVYLESGSNEPVPWAGACGFGASEPVPNCVSTNEIKFPKDLEGIPLPWGGECSDYQVVREHSGLGHRLHVTSVVNVGERGAPLPNVQSQAFQNYPGFWGDYAEDRVCFTRLFGCFCTGKQFNATSPYSPAFGNNGRKMWDRVGDGDPRLWGAPCHGLDHVFVDFSAQAPGLGTRAAPFARISDALGPLAQSGTVTLLGGTSPEAFAFCWPVVINAEETSTIGR